MTGVAQRLSGGERERESEREGKWVRNREWESKMISHSDNNRRKCPENGIYVGFNVVVRVALTWGPANTEPKK